MMITALKITISLVELKSLCEGNPRKSPSRFYHMGNPDN